MGIMLENCSMMTGSMGWIMPLFGIALVALLGLGVASLIKYLFTAKAS